MRVCPKCGYVDNLQWRHGFDYNSDYMRFDEAETFSELEAVTTALKDRGNFDPIQVGPIVYYRRGSAGMFLYRVLKEDFRVPIERKNHKHRLLEKPEKVSGGNVKNGF